MRFFPHQFPHQIGIEGRSVKNLLNLCRLDRAGESKLKRSALGIGEQVTGDPAHRAVLQQGKKAQH